MQRSVLSLKEVHLGISRAEAKDSAAAMLVVVAVVSTIFSLLMLLLPRRLLERSMAWRLLKFARACNVPTVSWRWLLERSMLRRDENWACASRELDVDQCSPPTAEGRTSVCDAVMMRR